MADTNIIYVCQSGTCQSKGSAATLVEIEELAKLVDTDCQVQRSGCLGYCRQGPAVEVIQAKSSNRRITKRRYHVTINTIQKSASVIEDATGETLPTVEDDLPEETKARLADVRAAKQREYFMKTYQWNKALAGLTVGSESSNAAHLQTIRDLLGRAGYPDLNPSDVAKKDPPLQLTTMPSSIDGYVKWKLMSVNITTHHTAIFHFETNDPKRGTPHPRGARMAEPITWHVTMLAEVGGNNEGPLPWVERDYTPISSALEWERGRCAVLIKIYNEGVLSSWLHKKTSEASYIGSGSIRTAGHTDINIWLSKPIKTLTVPSLIADNDDGFRPKSVLLLLAGTGIVALPQILAHREPYRLLGIPVPKYKQMNCPIDLIHSCHEDDVLLLEEIKQYCLEGDAPHPSRKLRGLRHYTLLVTRPSSHSNGAPPFQESFNDSNESVNYQALLKGVTNASIRSSRLNKDIIADAVERLEGSYRIVVSGPDSYNNAARGFLEECGVDSKSVTILSA